MVAAGEPVRPRLPAPDVRLAFFTPLSPVRSGISQYSDELLPRLSSDFEIDVYDRPRAHDFVWRHFTRPYDLTVYQLGNADCHEFMWPYLLRYPGLTVLHDAQLHQSRAAALLTRQKRADDYRAEFAFNHPGARAGIAELVIHGLAGGVLHFWPFVRAAVTSARAVAVHGGFVAADLRERFPDAAIEVIPMGVAAPAARDEDRAVVRARHAIPSDAIVFAAIGRVTPEKRIGQALGALATLAREAVDVRLLIVGERAPYFDVAEEARARGVIDRVAIAEYVAEEALGSYIHASDACLCLRWPTNGETSASWLRCLAAGKPTAITDLAHLAHVPSLDPRTWAPVPDGRDEPPVCVSIDILDEDHSLVLAMRRLARDAALRAEIGARARAYWRASHTIDRMADGYRRAIAAAAARPAPRVALPPHMRADGTALARQITSAFGVRVDVLPPPELAPPEMGTEDISPA